MTWHARLSAWAEQTQRGLVLVLLAGLLHGLIYVFVVPPWQHYDEPTHFEYAWLIAHRASLPAFGDYDQAMRRAVATSMLENGFFHDLNPPDLNPQEGPIWIGLTQLKSPPAYYLLVALPLRLFANSSITLQLYAGRLLSLLLYLLCIGISYGVMREITPQDHLLRLTVPATLALLPSFTDLMTSINNDVGATVFFSLFLWACVRLIRRGFSPFDFLWAIGAAGLCFWTKSTVMVAVPLLVVPLSFSLLRGKLRWLAWGGLWAAGSAGILFLFSWGDAALWYRDTRQTVSTSVQVQNAPLGKHAIGLTIPAGATASQVYQPLVASAASLLKGKTFTLGAWVWASEPVQARTPILDDGINPVSQPVSVGVTPTFHAITGTVSTNSDLIYLRLAATGKENIQVFYDGLVLVPGERPVQAPPQFEDAFGSQGIWGGLPFVNLARNASAETEWPWIHPRVETWVETTLGKYLYFSTRGSLVLATLLDWDVSRWYYTETGKNLLRTFWAKFGWGHVALPGMWYWFFGGISLVGLGGAVLGLRQGWRSAPWSILAFMGLTIALVWGETVVRGAQSILGEQYIFIPAARYAFPAIIPTVLWLNIGWQSALRMFRRLPTVVIQLVVFLLIDLVSLGTLISFYARR